MPNLWKSERVYTQVAKPRANRHFFDLKFALFMILIRQHGRLTAYGLHKQIYELISINISFGTIIPQLQLLELLGYAKSEVKINGASRHVRRFYSLTPLGEQKLRQLRRMYSALGLADEENAHRAEMATSYITEEPTS
jgi:DNA-binding PadR family transcriptional regulator